MEGIAWKVDRKARSGELQLFYLDNPIVSGLSCVWRDSVCQANLQTCTVEFSNIHIGQGFLKIDTMALKVKFFNIAFDTNIINQAIGIQFQIL